MTFASPTIYPVGPIAYNLANADFTGDGILDLATNVATFKDGATSYQVAVLRGNGDGSFQPAQLSPSPGGSILAGDVDGDGKADLIVASNEELHVLISDGTGSFEPRQPFALPSTGEELPQTIVGAVVGDVNADGQLDLIVKGETNQLVLIGPGSYGEYYYDNVRITYGNVLIGTGAGTFHPAATYFLDSDSTYSSPSSHVGGPSVGDFDGDSRIDILTSRVTTWGLGINPYSALEARLGNGDGTFQSPQVTRMDHLIGEVYFLLRAVADFNQDGRTDVLMDGEDFATATVAVGNADGTFTPLTPFDIGQDRSYDLVASEVGDVNGDGRLDLVFVKKLYESRWADVLLGDGDGTFGRPTTHELGSLAYAHVALADFNGDGFADLAAVDRNVGVIVHLNTGGPGPTALVLRITDASVTEGNSGATSMIFTVTLSHAATGPVTVQYATASGTATSGSDYQAASGTITFAPGETSKTIAVAVLGDQLFESNETFALHLSNPSGVTITDQTGIGTILNDDTLGTPTISINDAQILEGNSGTRTMTFTVTLSKASNKEVRVNYATANGTARTSDNDYTSASGTLKFAPGQTTKTITVTVKGDKKGESDETFSVKLSSAKNATIDDGTGVGTILNDDGGGSAASSSSSRAAAVDAAIELLTYRARKRGR
jgi:hypothetical protein